MRFDITIDGNEESGLFPIIFELGKGDFYRFFKAKTYGDPAVSVFVVLMCRAPYLKFRQRIRWHKQEPCFLGVDVMLSLDEMVALSPSARKKRVAEEIIKTLPLGIKKVPSKEWNGMEFLRDVEEQFIAVGWLPPK
jgi:hypothetical protein